MPEGKCYFCSDLEKWIWFDNQVGVEAIYSVSLIRQVHETKDRQYHCLSFCPECGKKIDFKALRESVKGDD